MTKNELIAAIRHDVTMHTKGKSLLTEDGEIRVKKVLGVYSVTDKHATTYSIEGSEKKVPLSRIRKPILEAIYTSFNHLYEKQ